ncbi:conserved membrane hypothetical protein [uncultured delta proteobacterium]|uniref:Major facilitator superfamily (MFS) profile domain-containing protein n=1 Tax=uncultured delta proteobacterium TaxID=34034 RepID=A0A212KB34_9DELT|nr:conserved membrane hypothetical protein [uncultured delta proteobacterium]
MIFTRNFVIVALINFFVMTAYYLLFVISSPYAADRFNASPSMAGLVAGMILMGCLAGRFFTGRIIAKTGFRVVLFSSIILYTASLGLYLLVDNLPFLMAVRFLNGIGVGCIGTVTSTLVVHIIPPHLHGQGINYFSLSSILALAFGPFFGLLLLQYVTFTEIFLLCAALGVVCFALAALLTVPPLEEDPVEAGATDSAFSLSSYIEYAAVPIGTMVLVICAGYGGVQAFMAFYAAEAGLDGIASTFFLIYAATAFCLRPIAGKMLDKRTPNVVIYPALILSSLGFLLLGTMPSATGLMLAGFLLGAGVSNIQTASQTISVRLVSKRRFGPATSTYFIFLDLGVGMGPYFLGFTVPYAGYKGMYLACMGLALISIPLYFLVHGRKAKRPS